MSLVGFKARNHQQQVGRRGANPKVDDRATTWEVFEPLHERFGFTIDVAASKENAKLERFYSIEDDGLSKVWSGERVWCNPPYSSIEPWVEKAAFWSHSHDSGVPAKHSPGENLWVEPAELIVMLLPANRTEQGWWQRWIEPGRRGGMIQAEFLPGRMRFLAPGEDTIKPNSRPPFGVCLVIWAAA
jgi:hypothetical protein